MKKLFCKHEWIMGHEVNNYFDFMGNRVSVWRCVCKKCNKWKNRKFW